MIGSRSVNRSAIIRRLQSVKGSCRGWGTPTEKIFVETKRDNFFPFHTRRFETSASYQWADKFSEPGDVPVSRNPRFKIQFLSATATTLNPISGEYHDSCSMTHGPWVMDHETFCICYFQREFKARQQKYLSFSPVIEIFILKFKHLLQITKLISAILFF